MTRRFDRLTGNDLTTLATDRGQVPMHIGAVLFFEPNGGPMEPAVAEIGERLARVPRLRQRLLRPPLLAGRPLWVDDAGFRISDHLTRVVGPADEAAVLTLAGELICRRLPPDRPLWRAAWVPGLPGGGFAVILVLHHVLADGMGGLAVLAGLVDGAPRCAPHRPHTEPTRWMLTKQALSSRAAALARSGTVLRRMWHGVREIGSGRTGRAVATSVTRPTSSQRELTPVTVPLASVVAIGRSAKATVNDVVVAAISGALFDLLAGRGEDPPRLVVSVPVSARAAQAASELGNQVGVIPVAVPHRLPPEQRVREIAARTAAAKAQPRGSSAIVLNVLFRSLAAVGLIRPFLDHQRLVHTFETNLRGPQTPVSMAGHRLGRIVPMAVNPGNVGVCFDVLSYAGELVVTIVSDPRQVPEPDLLARAILRDLAALA